MEWIPSVKELLYEWQRHDQYIMIHTVVHVFM